MFYANPTNTDAETFSQDINDPISGQVVKLDLLHLHSNPPRLKCCIQQRIKQTKEWCMEGAHGGRDGTKCATSRTVKESTLTCTCDGTEKAKQGQEERQLNFHCAETSSPVFSPVRIVGTHSQTAADTGDSRHTPEGGPQEKR